MRAQISKRSSRDDELRVRLRQDLGIGLLCHCFCHLDEGGYEQVSLAVAAHGIMSLMNSERSRRFASSPTALGSILGPAAWIASPSQFSYRLLILTRVRWCR